MIENERQYRITKAQLTRLQEALARSRKPSAKIHRRLYQAMIEGLQSQIDELREELAAYESLTQIFAVFFVPSGTADNSPAIYCWEPRWEGVRSAGGTAENIGITNFQPSLRDWDDVLGRESQQ